MQLEQLGYSPPSLSQQIRVLEDDLGAPLFTHGPGNVELTAAGEELLPIARRILADADNARRVLAELRDLERGRVRLGATPSLCTGLIPRILADHHRSHAGVAVLITEGGSRDLQNQLADGALDLALLVDSRAQDDVRLETTPLFVEELVVIPAIDSPTSTPRHLMDVSELAAARLVTFRDGYDLRETTIDACRTAGFEPTFAIEGREMDAVPGFVAAGLGVAVVLATVADTRFRTTRLRSPGLTRTVQLARRLNVPLSRASEELEREVRRFIKVSRVGST